MRNKTGRARDNPLLIDNYVVNALRTTLVTFKESGELHEALKEQIQTAMQSNNVIVACDIPRADGTHSITRESIVSKSRECRIV